MSLEQILEAQRQTAKELAKLSTRANNISIDIQGLKEGLVKELEKQGYQNVKELLA